MGHMNPIPVLDSTVTAGRLELAAGGSWTAAHADVLERLIEAAAPQVADAERISLDMARVEALDSIGAWLLERLIRRSNRDGKRAQFTGLPQRYRGLIEEMHAVNLQPRTPPKSPNRLWSALDGVGRAAAGLMSDVVVFLAMFGELSVALGRVMLRPRSFRLGSWRRSGAKVLSSCSKLSPTSMTLGSRRLHGPAWLLLGLNCWH